MIKDYPQARYELLAASIELAQWNLSQIQEGDSPRSVATKRFLQSAKDFKKSLRKEGIKEIGLGCVRFQTILAMLEAPMTPSQEPNARGESQ